MVKRPIASPAPRQARTTRIPPAARAAEPTDFYNPEGAVPRAAESQLGAQEIPREAFVAPTRESSDDLGPALSADRAVVDAAPFDPNHTDPAALQAEIARIRAIRKPLGAYNLKLDLPKRRGYHRHWFLDAAGRVDQAAENGWTHVAGKDGKPIRRNAGRGAQAGQQFAFAMEIPEVFWMEDQAFKHKIAQERVDAIRERPAVAKAGQSKAEDRGKFYNPHEEQDPVSIEKSNPAPM